MSSRRRLFLFVGLPLVAVFLAVVGYNLAGSSRQSQTTSTSQSATNDSCPTSIALKSPTDVSLATSILYPGQYRGGQYKPHGGFRFDNNTSNAVNVTIPLDGRLIEGSRYIERGEVQYLLVFETSRDVRYRFDHLQTLTAKFQAAADTLPEPKVDDSRTTTIDNVIVTAGEVVATEVGFKKSSPINVSFDFGVYDMTHKNDASKIASWATEHSSDTTQAPYAVCWLDLLPATDAALVKNLPAGDSQSGKTSDYCK